MGASQSNESDTPSHERIVLESDDESGETKIRKVNVSQEELRMFDVLKSENSTGAVLDPELIKELANDIGIEMVEEGEDDYLEDEEYFEEDDPAFYVEPVHTLGSSEIEAGMPPVSNIAGKLMLEPLPLFEPLPFEGMENFQESEDIVEEKQAYAPETEAIKEIPSHPVVSEVISEAKVTETSITEAIAESAESETQIELAPEIVETSSKPVVLESSMPEIAEIPLPVPEVPDAVSEIAKTLPEPTVLEISSQELVLEIVPEPVPEGNEMPSESIHESVHMSPDPVPEVEISSGQVPEIVEISSGKIPEVEISSVPVLEAVGKSSEPITMTLETPTKHIILETSPQEAIPEVTKKVSEIVETAPEPNPETSIEPISETSSEPEIIETSSQVQTVAEIEEAPVLASEIQETHTRVNPQIDEYLPELVPEIIGTEPVPEIIGTEPVPEIGETEPVTETVETPETEPVTEIVEIEPVTEIVGAEPVPEIKGTEPIPEIVDTVPSSEPVAEVTLTSGLSSLLQKAFSFVSQESHAEEPESIPEPIIIEPVVESEIPEPEIPKSVITSEAKHVPTPVIADVQPIPATHVSDLVTEYVSPEMLPSEKLADSLFGEFKKQEVEKIIVDAKLEGARCQAKLDADVMSAALNSERARWRSKFTVIEDNLVKRKRDISVAHDGGTRIVSSKLSLPESRNCCTTNIKQVMECYSTNPSQVLRCKDITESFDECVTQSLRAT